MNARERFLTWKPLTVCSSVFLNGSLRLGHGDA